MTTGGGRRAPVGQSALNVQLDPSERPAFQSLSHIPLSYAPDRLLANAGIHTPVTVVGKRQMVQSMAKGEAEVGGGKCGRKEGGGKAGGGALFQRICWTPKYQTLVHVTS